MTIPLPSVLRQVPARRVPSMACGNARMHARKNMLMFVVVSVVASAALPLRAQSAPRAGKAAAAPTLVGKWSGTASVPLGDSTITVPVLYAFEQNGSTIGGSAMVPGQGQGPISGVTVNGTKVRFTVTATATPAKPVPGKPAPPPPTPKALEHDGAFTADGAIEGFVNLDKQPVAKFRITPSKAK